MLCPYDTVGLPVDVIEEAQRSHPWVSRADGWRAMSAQCRDLELMAQPFELPLPPPASDAASVVFDFDDMPAVRRLVAVCARVAGLPLERIDDLVLAVHEIASNSVRHGGGTGTLRVWHDGGAVVCEVTDGGRIQAPLVGRQVPDDESLGGRGALDGQSALRSRADPLAGRRQRRPACTCTRRRRKRRPAARNSSANMPATAAGLLMTSSAHHVRQHCGNLRVGRRLEELVMGPTDAAQLDLPAHIAPPPQTWNHHCS